MGDLGVGKRNNDSKTLPHPGKGVCDHIPLTLLTFARCLHHQTQYQPLPDTFPGGEHIWLKAPDTPLNYCAFFIVDCPA